MFGKKTFIWNITHNEESATIWNFKNLNRGVLHGSRKIITRGNNLRLEEMMVMIKR